MEPKTYSLTEEQIAQGFFKWNNEIMENPENFDDNRPTNSEELKDYSQRQAKWLLEYIEKANA